MKRYIYLTAIFVFSQVQFLSAQAPDLINYQSVVRDANGNVVANQIVKLRFTIHDGSPGGNSEYSEIDSGYTNQFGLYTTAIGSGAQQVNSFSSITWGSGQKYLEVEYYSNAGASFVQMGTSQLLSVPYALYAAHTAAGGQGATGATGAQGPAGATGANGTNGPAGATGAQGPTGNDGAAGAAGAQGPTGNDGAAGATGAQGPTGNDGAIGATGAQGPTGNDGAVGTTGAQGPTGNDGATGPTGAGATGPTGPQGLAGLGLNDQGNWVSGTTYNPGDYVFAPSSSNPLINSLWIDENSIPFTSTIAPASDPADWVELQTPSGPTGATGPTGNDGAAGATGTQGPTGNDGAVGAQGPTGNDGAVGATGAQGPTGNDGAVGPAGVQGPTGNDGAAGATGAQGPTGNDGAVGATGAQGLVGNDGATGPTGTGATGPTGPSGIGLNDRGDWVSITVYNPGDYVFAPSSANPLVNSMWIDQNSGSFNSTVAPASDPADWVELQTPSGPTGATGPTGNDGAAGATGAQGPTGNDGANGATGAQGPTGNDGAAGATGPTGANGNDGATGPSGTNGSDGATGPTGAAGPAGSLTGVTGATGDLITYDGSNWVAKSLVIDSTGGGAAVNNIQPYLGLNFCIYLAGIYPPNGSGGQGPFLSEIIMFPGNFAPGSTAFCDGQLLPISSNTALFSLLGTTYGGNGITTFALPDLRGRVPIHSGTGSGLSSYSIGQTGGTETNVISISQMPAHNHPYHFQ